MQTNYYFLYKSIMETNVSVYLKYLISDEEIIKSSEKMTSSLNDIIDRMQDLGIDVSKIIDENYDVDNSIIRDFKIKRILNNEGNR